MRDKGKIIYLIILFTLLPVSSIFGAVITRNDVISNARLYLNLSWSPLKDTCLSLNPHYTSFFKVGENYTGEAYCWGGFDSMVGLNQQGRHHGPTKD